MLGEEKYYEQWIVDIIILNATIMSDPSWSWLFCQTNLILNRAIGQNNFTQVHVMYQKVLNSSDIWWVTIETLCGVGLLLWKEACFY